MGRLLNAYINKTINYLARQGQLIAMQAWRTAATKIDTGNQRDAFGWGVYYKGSLKKYGYGGPELATEPHRDLHGGDSFGREWIFDYLQNEFKPTTDGFCLVIANAAWYSIEHETGRTPSGKKYKIISQIFNMLTPIANEFRGATTELTVYKN